MIDVTDCPIVATGLCKAFGQLRVLNGVDLSVERGEVVVIMGRSGSGKTTLLRCLNLLEEPDAGTVRVCSLEVNADRAHAKERDRTIREVRRRAGMVFQQFNLFPHLTALGNVTEGPMTVLKKPRSEAAALGLAMLRRVGLEDKANEYPARLSGGQKQRVAIARALAMDPEVVLFDEPTSSLDPELHEEVLQTMRDLARDGMTMIVVTHEIRFAADVADRVLFMEGGRIVEEGPPSTFFSAPRHPATRTFLRLVEHQTPPDPAGAQQ